MSTAEIEDLDRTLADSGPAGALDHLARVLADRGEFRALLDAMLLRARVDLGLPTVLTGSLADLPEPARTRYEGRYVEAIRAVGRRLLDSGEIGAAWAYFRAIAEKEPVAAAIEAYQPPENDERIGQVVEVAVNQGVHPLKGFGLILDHYGTCSAISAFEGLPPYSGSHRHCTRRKLFGLKSKAFSIPSVRNPTENRCKRPPCSSTPTG